MASYIEDNLTKLKKSHYIRLATAKNYWFDFSYLKTKNIYENKYGDKFCFVIQGSTDIDDDYILPFAEIKEYFSKESLSEGRRWTGIIRNNIMRIWFEGNTKSISVSRYYKAYDLLNNAVEPTDFIVKEADIIKYEVDKIDSNHLLEIIKTYNKKYEEVIPEKKIVVSEHVSRPGLITDYIKQLQNYTCQLCKQKGFIQSNYTHYIEAHHIVELHKLIKGSLCSDNIIIVCPTCHKKLHYAKVAFNNTSDLDVIIKINGVDFSVKRNIITK